jgi:hypothetical protein
VVTNRDFDLLREDRTDQRTGELAAMNFLVLRHQRITGERVVVLPARERTDPSDPVCATLSPAASPCPQIIRS